MAAFAHPDIPASNAPTIALGSGYSLRLGAGHDAAM
jgi:hypothetical protein